MFLVFAEESGVQPVSDIKSVSPMQLGNKAYRCCQLSLSNFNVPRSLALPVSVYEAHIYHLGLEEPIDVVLKNPDSTSTVTTLNTIRRRIRESSLGDDILTGIRWFIGSRAAGVSVRSSALSEDTRSRSAAGQFATVLNCKTVSEVERAILECWSSLWTPVTLGYNIVTAANNDIPKMAVLIMEMVDSSASGVLFTRNPITGADEIVIEAVWGLGEGLVSRGMTPDRLIFDSHMRKVQVNVAYKPNQYSMTNDKSRIVRVDVPPENRELPALPDEQSINLCTIAKKVESFFGEAQDLEWAVDASGALWILQSRDITSTTIPIPTFLPPGPGEWRIIDHIAHPGTRCFSEYYYAPMEEGWNEEARWIGTINRVKIREVNGFMYYQMSIVESEQEFSRMCETIEGYWQEKRFLSALRLWDESIKPAATEQLMTLQGTELDELSGEELLKHLERCFVAAKQMVKNHHRFTYTSFIPVGDLIRQVCEWTGKEPTDILEALRGSDPNRLLVARDHFVIRELLDDLQNNTTALRLLTTVDREPESARQILNELLALDGGIGRGLCFLLDHFGYRVVNGYDIASETFVERPRLLLESVESMLSCRDSRSRYGNEKAIRTIRDLVPDEKKPLFEEMLSDVREMGRLRYERGIYSDLWAIGILRHVFLEAGKRLAQKGLIETPELALDASYGELVALLNETYVVSSEELQRRAQYRTCYSVMDVPPVLGEPTAKQPDASNLPPSLARTMAGLMTAVTLAVDHVRYTGEQQDALVGVPASRGIVQGTAKVISSDTQLKSINRGDILVVYQTTAAFNAVFPLIGGIVSEFGGVLSHPAILAREYGIPCIVGCSGAMERIQTGMHVRLDGSRGEVQVISDGVDVVQRLESLKCEYYGPMRGRNRDRVLNHVDAVSARLGIMTELCRDGNCLDILRMHFYDEISADEAVNQLVNRFEGKGEQSQIRISGNSLEDFVQRYHIEFHPCDACNLICGGCTYFQDTISKPDSVSYPFDQMAKICSTIRPRAITLVGGGEPALYRSGTKKLGDLICALGGGDFGCTPAIGLITNGTLWPPGNQQWHHHVQWVRFSLDASTTESYKRSKGKDYFDQVVNNVFRVLTETTIPQVGVGFLYHPGNIVEAGPVIALFGNRIRELCPEHLHRFNVQFRPWRVPTGRPSVKERILSRRDIQDAAAVLSGYLEDDSFLGSFIRQNTNIAVNLLCGGARETAMPFSECFFGLAKTVVRADGSLYPCFRVAAQEDPLFYCGNVITDTPLKIALRELYVTAVSVRQTCVPDHDKCLFCVFNNMLEDGIAGKSQPTLELAGDYFF
jgi:pyruvate,water dikinase